MLDAAAPALLANPDYVPANIQEPAHWLYSIDPATGVSRADYFGELFLNGGSVLTASSTTGSGAFVLQNGPTIAGPTLSGTVTNAGTISGGTLSGTITNGGLINGGTLGAPLIIGVTNGSNAPAGDVGEFLSVAGTSTAVPNGAWTFVTGGSLTLTPGDWDVWGIISVAPSANNVGSLYGTLSLTANSQGTLSVATVNASGTAFGFSQTQLALPMWRQNVTSNTTIYLNTYATFSSGTCTANGQIFARRVR